MYSIRIFSHEYFMNSFIDRRQAAPRFVIKPQSAFAYEGQSVKFTCRVIAIAPAVLTWYRNNQELRQSVKFMKRYIGDDYTFVINRVKLEDRGEYIIRAENHYGYREEVVFLNVQRKYKRNLYTIKIIINITFSNQNVKIYALFRRVNLLRLN
jgi:hypothetical protein